MFYKFSVCITSQCELGTPPLLKLNLSTTTIMTDSRIKFRRYHTKLAIAYLDDILIHPNLIGNSSNINRNNL